MSAIANVGNGDPPTTNEEAFLFYQDKAEKANSPVNIFRNRNILKRVLLISS